MALRGSADARQRPKAQALHGTAQGGHNPLACTRAAWRRRVKGRQPAKAGMSGPQLGMDTRSRIFAMSGWVLLGHVRPRHAGENHLGSSPHDLGGYATAQPDENGSLAGATVATAQAPRQIDQHLLGARVEAPPAADNEGMVLNPGSLHFVLEWRKAGALARVHGNDAVRAGSCSRGTNHTHIHGRQAPVVKGAS